MLFGCGVVLGRRGVCERRISRYLVDCDVVVLGVGGVEIVALVEEQSRSRKAKPFLRGGGRWAWMVLSPATAGPSEPTAQIRLGLAGLAFTRTD